MKRLFFFIALLLALGAAADDFAIRCTTYPVWLLTAQIAEGSGVPVEVVIPPGTGCPHDYVLTPRDMEKLSEKNQIVVVNGLGMDGFILEALAKVNPAVPVVEATVADAKIALPEAGGWNPHWFASPDTAREMVRNITEGLAARDAAHAGLYQANAQTLDASLAALEARFAASRSGNAPAVVIQHGIFAYMARLAGFRPIRLSESDDETNLTPVQLRQLVRKVRAEKAVAIWADSHAPQGAVNALARECKLPVIMIDGLSGGPANPEPGHFVKTLERDLELIHSHR